MELRGLRDLTEEHMLELQNNVLQTVRIRSEDPISPQLSHLCVPRDFVTSSQFQEELERYVATLVLFDDTR